MVLIQIQGDPNEKYPIQMDFALEISISEFVHPERSLFAKETFFDTFITSAS